MLSASFYQRLQSASILSASIHQVPLGFVTVCLTIFLVYILHTYTVPTFQSMFLPMFLPIPHGPYFPTILVPACIIPVYTYFIPTPFLPIFPLTLFPPMFLPMFLHMFLHIFLTVAAVPLRSCRCSCRKATSIGRTKCSSCTVSWSPARCHHRSRACPPGGATAHACPPGGATSHACPGGATRRTTCHGVANSSISLLPCQRGVINMYFVVVDES